jgi:hypothetical protein
MLLGAWLTPTPALAGPVVSVQVNLPLIRFEQAPPLVVVQEGVQVVPDYGEEVFFVDGWYWCRRHDYWYRTRDHRGGWVVVERRYVPVTLVRIPPGRYKHWKAGKPVKVKAVKVKEYREVRDDRDDRKHHGRGNGKGHGHGRK